MPLKIIDIKHESSPACRLIGRRYDNSPNWGEWWENNWFAALETMQPLPVNGDAYIGAVHIVDGTPEYWIGMLFPHDMYVPAEFDYVDIEPLDYAVCYLYDKEGSGDFYTMETHEMCIAQLCDLGMKRKEDDWCFERYNCPRFTAPDEQGNVLLDYLISIE